MKARGEIPSPTASHREPRARCGRAARFATSGLVAVLLAGAGCGPVPRSWALSIGPPMPPVDECVLRINRITASEAAQRYQPVGVVCLGLPGAQSTDEIQNDGAALEMLRWRACDLGGDIVVPVGFCSVSRPGSGRYTYAGYGDVAVGGIEYRVFREAATSASGIPRR